MRIKPFVMPGAVSVPVIAAAIGSSQDTIRRHFSRTPGVLRIGKSKSAMRVPWPVLDAEIPGAAKLVQEWLQLNHSSISPTDPIRRIPSGHGSQSRFHGLVSKKVRVRS